MVRVISQETFDAVVQENMEDFDMSKEDAIKEAKEQFESQGVDLNNIVFETSDGGVHAVVQLINDLRELQVAMKTDDIKSDIIAKCSALSSENKKSLAEKVLSTKSDGYQVLMDVISATEGDTKASALSSLAVLLEGNPDPLTEAGMDLILKELKSENSKVVDATLSVALSSCVRHEHNRQDLVQKGLLSALDHVVDRFPVQVSILWQALVQDDDVRVPYGKAHDTARAIVEEHEAINKLTNMISDSSRSKSDLSLLLSCLSSLSVRNEYCQAVVDQGGLKCILDLLMDPDLEKEVVRQALRLVMALAGNDNVKKDVKSSNGIPLILGAIQKFMGFSSISFMGCSALTVVCLRNTENALQVMEAGGANIIVDIMKTHKDNQKVQDSCAKLIRNIVSRSHDLIPAFVDLDIESLLHTALQGHPAIQDSVKAALRDLQLKVELKERWTGKEPKVTN